MDASRPSPRCVPLSARPAVSAAAAFILGIVAHPTLPRAPGTWLVLMAMLALAAASRRWRDGVRTVCLALAVIAGGLAAAQLAAYSYPANHISQFVGEEPR